MYRTQGKTSVPKNDSTGGNGACMRCLPIALACINTDHETIVKASRIQAHVTHNCDLSDFATEHVIELVQAALVGKDKSELQSLSEEFVRENKQFRFDTIKPVMNPSGFIVDTLKAVFQSLYTTDNFESCLVDIVNRGGDSDTTGAIAGMIAGALYGLDAIPGKWFNELGEDIKNQCFAQADHLLEAAPIEVCNIFTQEQQDEGQLSL
jgi:ADP-ribosyl-[dinitrogen reductase] hydrolase